GGAPDGDAGEGVAGPGAEGAGAAGAAEGAGQTAALALLGGEQADQQGPGHPQGGVEGRGGPPRPGPEAQGSARHGDVLSATTARAEGRRRRAGGSAVKRYYRQSCQREKAILGRRGPAGACADTRVRFSSVLVRFSFPNSVWERASSETPFRPPR